MTAPAIGIDVGGTKIAAAVVAADGSIISRSSVATSPESPNAITTGIVKAALELKAGAPAVCAIGVGLAGLVDAERGIVLAAPNIAYRNLDVRSLVADRVGLPVFIDNDANVAAWAEARFGAGRGYGDQITVTVGTGIGGGLILNGEIYRGAHSFGAEIGHMILERDGPACGCGARGCFETLASGNAIGRIARERLAAGEGEDSALAGTEPSGEDVGRAAVAGDAFARSVVAAVGTSLGAGLASLVNLLDPDVIVVGGGAAAGTGELLLEPARESMQAYVTLRDHRKETPVLAAELGNDAGAVGAADLARRLAAAV